MAILRPRTVPEREAEGELANVYHDIKQTLRVSGINLVFSRWAAYKKFLPEMWSSFRSNAETRAFEDMADHLRAEAVRSAAAMGRLMAAEAAPLGESQSYQLDAALDLYHYINPKLLLITAAVAEARDGGDVGGVARHARLERIERGVPPKMYPMEMVAEKPDDKELRDLFQDIKETLSLESIHSDYRTLALWPVYLFVFWGRLAPFLKRAEYSDACASLRNSARNYARNLPLSFELPRGRMESADVEEVLEITRGFERSLPGLIVNIALIQLDRHPLESCLASPFPAASRDAVPVEILA